MIDIVHFSTVHPRDDSRIRAKMMSALSEKYSGRVALFVQDGLGDERDPVAGYDVIDTGPRLRRIKRMSLGGWRMFRTILRSRPKVGHFHDPELIPWAVALRLFGIRMIYDVHEDYPEAVSENYRLPRAARTILPPIVRLFEWASMPFFSAIVAVTPQIQQRFAKTKTILVRNFPMVREFHEPADTPMRERPGEFAYIGTITRNRNIIGMIEAVGAAKDTNVALRLAGHFPVAADKEAAEALPAWDKVRFDGWVSRDGVADILANARAGLVVLKPVAHEMQTLPIKLFEYMAAGVPVISSDFPIWREIVDEAGCGLLVDPNSPEQIAEAMQWMLDNPEEAQLMGQRGHEAVLARFNWERESETLIQAYEKILDGR